MAPTKDPQCRRCAANTAPTSTVRPEGTQMRRSLRSSLNNPKSTLSDENLAIRNRRLNPPYYGGSANINGKPSNECLNQLYRSVNSDHAKKLPQEILLMTIKSCTKSSYPEDLIKEMVVRKWLEASSLLCKRDTILTCDWLFSCAIRLAPPQWSCKDHLLLAT